MLERPSHASRRRTRPTGRIGGFHGFLPRRSMSARQGYTVADAGLTHTGGGHGHREEANRAFGIGVLTECAPSRTEDCIARRGPRRIVLRCRVKKNCRWPGHGQEVRRDGFASSFVFRRRPYLLGFAPCGSSARFPSPRALSERSADFRSQQQTAGGGFDAQIAFTNPLATTVSVQLRRPDGTMNLPTRQADGSFECAFNVSDATQLSGFPDGAYTLGGSGGIAPSGAAFLVDARDPPSPVLLTHFDALRSRSDLTPEALAAHGCGRS